MKKTLIIGLLLTGFVSFSQIETKAMEAPSVLNDTTVTVNVEQEENDSLINYDSMKKSDKIRQSREEARQQKAPRIDLNSKEMTRQRNLDFMRQQTNAIFPGI